MVSTILFYAQDERHNAVAWMYISLYFQRFKI
jgi:hypothetical protein